MGFPCSAASRRAVPEVGLPGDLLPLHLVPAGQDVGHASRETSARPRCTCALELCAWTICSSLEPEQRVWQFGAPAVSGSGHGGVPSPETQPQDHEPVPDRDGRQRRPLHRPGGDRPRGAGPGLPGLRRRTQRDGGRGGGIGLLRRPPAGARGGRSPWTTPPPGARTSPPASPEAPAPVQPCVLNGHVDTIPIGVSWPPRREDGWVCGRGAEDMKGGLVAMVHAARAVQRALQRSATTLRRDVWLTAVVGARDPGGPQGRPPAPDRAPALGPASRRRRSWSARARRRSGGPASARPSLTSPWTPPGPRCTPSTSRTAENPVRAFVRAVRRPGRPGRPPRRPPGAPPRRSRPDQRGDGQRRGLPQPPPRPPARHRNAGAGARARRRSRCRRNCCTLAQDAAAASGLDLRPSVELTARARAVRGTAQTIPW